MLGGTGAVGGWVEGGVGFELVAGVGGAALTEAGAAAAVVELAAAVELQAAAAAAEGVWDEEVLPCYSVETAAEAWSCGGLADPENRKKG